MSDHYIGPFGRVLPVRDRRRSGEDRDPSDRHWAASDHLYRLPPPRKTIPLQSGMEISLQQQNISGRSNSGTGLGSKDPGRQQIHREQLPPVSQLLTPASYSSFPGSPYSPRPHVNSPPSEDSVNQSPVGDRYDSSTQPFLRHTPGLVSRTGPSSVLYSSKHRTGQEQQQMADKLPPISQVGVDPTYVPLNESRSYAATNTDSSIPAHPHTSSLYHSTPYGKEEARSQLPSSQWDRSVASSPGSSQLPQVLPHVVDERYIEGEGICYIYADGSHCPKSIDGVPVNANWGITKAGKPRKRLAQACITCREKKIKCQPNISKCDQCQKSGRECRFENVPRGNLAASKSSQYGSRPMTSRPKDGNSDQSPASDTSIISSSVAGSIREIQTDFGQPQKRRRRGSSNPSSSAGDSSKRTTDMAITGDTPDRVDILAEITDVDPNDPLVSEWDTDPYEIDPEAMSHYIDKYFTYVNDGIYHMFPKNRFLLWLRSCRTKSPGDKMLLYSMLAMGSVFSDRPDSTIAGKRYLKTASYAVERSQHRLTLQLAQSRIILSMWYYSIGALVRAWDLIGAAVRTVCALCYNVESDGLIVEQNRMCEYGLHPQALIECRRRTFWVAFLIDRLPAFHSHSPVSMQPQDAFLRLPCREDIYEAQQYVTVPYFRNTVNISDLSGLEGRSSLSPMSYLIEMASLWGEVSHHIFRSPHIPPKVYRTWFEDFYETIIKRSEDSIMSLPDHFSYSMANMERSIRAGKTDTFVSVHMLYHAVLMKLNRHARHGYLPGEMVYRNIHRARHHAVEILRISLALTHFNCEHDISGSAIETWSRRTTFSTPFISHLVVSAADVLSVAGLMMDLSGCISLINGGLDVVEDLCRYWDSARTHFQLIEERLKAMITVVRGQTKLDDKVGFAVDGLPLDIRAEPGGPRVDIAGAIDCDLVYGLPREQYLQVLGLDVSLAKGNILWIKEGK